MNHYHVVTKAILYDCAEAAKLFGEYTMGDKGADEVMDVDICVKYITALPEEEAKLVLNQLLHEASTCQNYPCDAFLCCAVHSLEEWPFFEDADIANVIGEYY